MLFSKPYHIDDDLLADTRSEGAKSDETPLRYHLNKHTQRCSCGQTNCWSELTITTFHRARKTKIVRAAAKYEYNLPVEIHHHEIVLVDVCSFCAPFKSLADLPMPIVPIANRPVPLGWRKEVVAGAAPKPKAVVTDDDLLA